MFTDKEIEYESGENEGWSVKGEFSNYVYAAAGKEDTGEFSMTGFLACIVFFMWIRFIQMLQLTRVFGPILTIIKSMFTEVAKFLFIWIVVLCMLASVASLLFGHL